MVTEQKIIHRLITLDGIDCDVRPKDLDKDGTTGGIETISPDMSSIDMSTTSETKDSMKEAFSDDTDDSGMSQVDMKAIINPADLHDIAVFESAIWLNFLPSKLSRVTRKMLRLSIAQHGRGRDDLVSISIGGHRAEQQAGVKNRIKRFLFGNRENNLEVTEAKNKYSGNRFK